MEFRPWYYLQESVESEVLLTENFKDKKQQFLNQGATPEEVDKYFEIFKKIQNTDYKKVTDVIPGLTVTAPNRRNIDMYPNFDQLKIFVDYMRSQENLEVDIEVVRPPIFENNVLEISYGDSPKACITYKGDIPYSWCVARKTANVYNTYRFQPHEPSFYFVKNKIRTKKELSSWNPKDINEKTRWKDPWHFFLVQVSVDADLNDQNTAQYVVTSAQNDSDEEMSWSQIVQLEPALKQLQYLFKPRALPPEDRAFIDRWKNGATDKEFARMSFKEKSKFMSVYVNLEQRLSDTQFASLPPILRNEYVNFGVGLTDKQFDMIKDERDLVKRYTELSIRKFNDLVAQNTTLSYLQPSEWKMLKDHAESLDWNKMSDPYVWESLSVATDEETMLNLMVKHKKLTLNNIHAILVHSKDLSTIEQDLGKENVKKMKQFLNKQKKRNFSDLFNLANDWEKLVDVLLNHYQKEFTEQDIEWILIKSKNIQKIATKLGERNLKKINNFNDYQMRSLLAYARDQEGIRYIIAKYRQK